MTDHFTTLQSKGLKNSDFNFFNPRMPKQYITLVSHIHKVIGTGTDPEPCKTLDMEHFAKIVIDWKPSPIFAKHSMLSIWQVYQYASDILLLNLNMSEKKTWNRILRFRPSLLEIRYVDVSSLIKIALWKLFFFFYSGCNCVRFLLKAIDLESFTLKLRYRFKSAVFVSNIS